MPDFGRRRKKNAPPFIPRKIATSWLANERAESVALDSNLELKGRRAVRWIHQDNHSASVTRTRWFDGFGRIRPAGFEQLVEVRGVFLCISSPIAEERVPCVQVLVQFSWCLLVADFAAVGGKG